MTMIPCSANRFKQGRLSPLLPFFVGRSRCSYLQYRKFRSNPLSSIPPIQNRSLRIEYVISTTLVSLRTNHLYGIRHSVGRSHSTALAAENDAIHQTSLHLQNFSKFKRPKEEFKSIDSLWPDANVRSKFVDPILKPIPSTSKSQPTSRSKSSSSKRRRTVSQRENQAIKSMSHLENYLTKTKKPQVDYIWQCYQDLKSKNYLRYMNPALLGSILATFEESLSYSKTTSINKDSEDATSSSPSRERRRRWRSVLTNQNDSESEWRPTVQFTEKDKEIISRTYELIQDGIDNQISFSSSAIHHFLSIMSPSHETSMKTILLFQLIHSPKTNLTVPTISTYNHMFQSILSYKHEINDHLIETLHRQLKSHENLTFNQNTYRSLILLYHALKSDKGNQKALSLFNELKNLGITPGVGIINRIIDIHGRMYNPISAQEVFEEAHVFNGEKSEAKPNIKTLNYLITALTDIRPPASESPPSFVSSFPIFASHSSNSNSSIGNVASTAIAHSSSSLATSSGLDLAVHYFKSFQQQYNVVPNIETYNRLISAFLLHNDTDSAITYFNEMLSKSFTPPPQIWSSILFKILAKGDYDTAKRFFLYAQENGFLFDGKLTSVFIKALMTQRGVARFYTKYVDMVIDTAGVFFVVVSVCGGVSIIGLLNT